MMTWWRSSVPDGHTFLILSSFLHRLPCSINNSSRHILSHVQEKETTVGIPIHGTWLAGNINTSIFNIFAKSAKCECRWLNHPINVVFFCIILHFFLRYYIYHEQSVTVCLWFMKWICRWLTIISLEWMTRRCRKTGDRHSRPAGMMASITDRTGEAVA